MFITITMIKIIILLIVLILELLIFCNYAAVKTISMLYTVKWNTGRQGVTSAPASET